MRSGVVWAIRVEVHLVDELLAIGDAGPHSVSLRMSVVLTLISGREREILVLHVLTEELTGRVSGVEAYLVQISAFSAKGISPDHKSTLILWALNSVPRWGGICSGRFAGTAPKMLYRLWRYWARPVRRWT